uniref:Uncharacterized protein n=1 Tax=Rhizophora mucronata TaxID=61149 RepID=A0A2P2NGN0_RHIMU
MPSLSIRTSGGHCMPFKSPSFVMGSSALCVCIWK